MLFYVFFTMYFEYDLHNNNNNNNRLVGLYCVMFSAI